MEYMAEVSNTQALEVEHSLNRSSAMRNGHNVEIPIPDRTKSIHGRMLRHHSAAERCKKLSTHSAPWTVNSEA